MIRFFKQHELHTILVPDVAAAAAGLPTSAKGAQRGIKQSTNEVRPGGVRTGATAVVDGRQRTASSG